MLRSFWTVAALVYVAGVAWGLLAGDARPVERVALALLWPLGPLAFAVTIVVLLAASLIAYPLVAFPVLAGIVFLSLLVFR